MTANGSIARCGDSCSSARYHATPPNSSASVTRSTTESKNAPRWLDVFGRLRERAVEQVGQRGEHDEQQPEAQLTEADRDRRADGDEDAERR